MRASAANRQYLGQNTLRDLDAEYTAGGAANQSHAPQAVRQLSRLHRLQPDSPPARIAELRVRSGVSIYRRTPLRFHLESRWPSVGYFSNEHHAFASRNPIAKASR